MRTYIFPTRAPQVAADLARVDTSYTRAMRDAKAAYDAACAHTDRRVLGGLYLRRADGSTRQVRRVLVLPLPRAA